MTINATTSQPVTPSTVVRFQPGEIVDVTIRAARVIAPRLSFGDVLTLAYEEVEPGVFATIELRHPQAGSVTIERSAPVDWPPQQGDVWEGRSGALWFARRLTGSTVMLSDGGPSAELDDLVRWHSPLTLVYRRESDGDQ